MGNNFFLYALKVLRRLRFIVRLSKAICIDPRTVNMKGVSISNLDGIVVAF
jgi:hypothetical protein